MAITPDQTRMVTAQPPPNHPAPSWGIHLLTRWIRRPPRTEALDTHLHEQSYRAELHRELADLDGLCARVSSRIDSVNATLASSAEESATPQEIAASISREADQLAERVQHGFFTPGQKFRQPAFLATSFSRHVAENFIRMRGGDDCVLWTIRIDPERKCKHVNLVTKTNVEGEQEYLFAPYSAFTVLSVEWAAGTISEPHQIELLAAVDNKEEPEDLPLAPWS